MAQRFDLERRQLTGDAALVTQNVLGVRGAAHNAFSASSNGTLALVDASVLNLQLEWSDRAGRRVEALGEATLLQASPRVSRDGRIAVTLGPFGGEDIWVYETGGRRTRLTFDRATDHTPIWSGDGNRLVFQSTRGPGRGGFYEVASKGGTETRLLDCQRPCELLDLSADGRFIVFAQRAPSQDLDLWVLPLSGDRTPFLYHHLEGDQGQAQISPDGRWLAYTSTETGRNEVYLQTFPRPGRKIQVSAAAGVQPRWRRDGSEIFYLRPDGMLVAVPLTRDLEAGAPLPLFQTRVPTWGVGAYGWRTTYDVSPDGQRVLLITPPVNPTPISVTLNWPALLQR
jgi:Tol biopolymer transport system component